MRIESYHLDGCVYVKTSKLRMTIVVEMVVVVESVVLVPKISPGACDAKIGMESCRSLASSARLV